MRLRKTINTSLKSWVSNSWGCLEENYQHAFTQLNMRSLSRILSVIKQPTEIFINNGCANYTFYRTFSLLLKIWQQGKRRETNELNHERSPKSAMPLESASPSSTGPRRNNSVVERLARDLAKIGRRLAKDLPKTCPDLPDLATRCHTSGRAKKA